MQVLRVIQANALKFTQRGKVETIVEVVEKEEGGQFLKISVDDSGIGIPVEKQDKLFKLFGFRQSSKDTMSQNGIGFGLVISQLIVEQFGGTLTFESVAGKGSCFTFTFKLKATGMSKLDQFGSPIDRPKYLDQAQLVYEWKEKSLLTKIESNDQIIEQADHHERQGVSYKFQTDEQEQISHLKRILVVDDQSFNIDAALLILKYVVKV